MAINGNDNINLLVVSTYLKNISQHGNLPQFSGWKSKNILSCHHPVKHNNDSKNTFLIEIITFQNQSTKMVRRQHARGRFSFSIDDIQLQVVHFPLPYISLSECNLPEILVANNTHNQTRLDSLRPKFHSHDSLEAVDWILSCWEIPGKWMFTTNHQNSLQASVPKKKQRIPFKILLMVQKSCSTWNT